MAFQSELVEAFIQAIVVYPVGTLVELSTGQVGVVIAQNRVRHFKPKIILILDEGKVAYRISPILDLLLDPQDKQKTDRHYRCAGAEGVPFRFRVQIGMATYPENAVDAEELMKCVDAATVIAGNTPDKYFSYVTKDDHETTTMFAMEDELEKAISEGDIQYHYQPKADIRTGVIAGFEVLSRWNSRKWGFVRPDMIINAAERSNLITDLTVDSLTKTFKEFTELQATCGNQAITLSVNLSAKILNNTESIERVINTVNIWCAHLENLVLEITEGAIMTDPEAARDVLNQLHDNGIRISIDDFGTGYSSLSYLKKLPVDELKIDKSFVMELLQSDDDVMIVQTIIDLARNFNLNIVAEGTESKEIIMKLRDMGCHAAQGYYISKPIPFEQLSGWISAWDPAKIL